MENKESIQRYSLFIMQKKIKMIVVAYGALGLMILFFHYSCPFQSLTGLPCPGCNMTTALYYFMNGNLESSLTYHAMLIPTIFCFLLLTCFYCMDLKKAFNFLLWVWVIGMLVYYIWRMITIFPSIPMVYDSDSLLGKAWKVLTSKI